ncbi:MAG: (Fe-S)-binding protein, partial [Chloroflexota bacterium]
MTVPARWIFWNIPQSYIFFVLSTLALLAAAYGIYRRYRLWRLGGGDNRLDHLRSRMKYLLAGVFGQKRIAGIPYAGVMHIPLFMFMIFVVLFAAPAVTGLQRNLHESSLHDSLYLYYFLALDIFGLLAVAGTVPAAFRRYVLKPGGLDNRPDDAIALALIFLGLMTGFLLTALRIMLTGTVPHHPSWALWSPVSFVFVRQIASIGLGQDSLRTWYQVVWWGHAVLALGTLAWVFVSWSKLTHMLTDPLNILLRSSRPNGALKPTLDFEKREAFGAAYIEDFTWKQLLDLDACTRCGRCQMQCPALASGKPPNPKKVIQDLRGKLVKRQYILLGI